MSQFPQRRLRRLRSSETLREMLAQVRLDRSDLIAPLFVREGSGITSEISSMPGQFQFSVDTAMETARKWSDLGIPAVLLFGIPDEKDDIGSQAWSDKAAVQRLIRQIKKVLPQMVVITDVCLCEYTDHGHCGKVAKLADGSAAVDNDATLELLSRVAISHAHSGADIVAPSAMMDGQVSAIRSGLDDAGLTNAAIMSYAVKFASSFYGPFRDAAGSSPQFGDRRSYQMDYRAVGQVVAEAQADVDEGADMLMVKPAGAYLDVIAGLRELSDHPLAAYQVSGGYAMICAAAKQGWIDPQAAMVEVTTAIKRAGADLIITYFAERLAKLL